MPQLIPFRRRRSRLASATKAARNLALLRAGLALVQTRLARRIPGMTPKRTVTPGRVALAGGALAGVAVLARLLGRRGDDGGGGSSTPSAPSPPPAPANYDAPGPPANTATPVAAPVADLDDVPAIDEEGEVEAAAAEAAGIGGPSPDYASTEASLIADEAERPLVESGEGESEGQDQTEAELLDNATAPYGPGAGMTDAERQIDQAIADQENPAVGETPDPAAPPEGSGSR
jgi:hypothetical protein